MEVASVSANSSGEPLAEGGGFEPPGLLGHSFSNAPNTAVVLENRHRPGCWVSAPFRRSGRARPEGYTWPLETLRCSGHAARPLSPVLSPSSDLTAWAEGTSSWPWTIGCLNLDSADRTLRTRTGLLPGHVRPTGWCMSPTRARTDSSDCKANRPHTHVESDPNALSGTRPV
jgi:hypothetical protein